MNDEFQIPLLEIPTGLYDQRPQLCIALKSLGTSLKGLEGPVPACLDYATISSDATKNIIGKRAYGYMCSYILKNEP